MRHAEKLHSGENRWTKVPALIAICLILFRTRKQLRWLNSDLGKAK